LTIIKKTRISYRKAEHDGRTNGPHKIPTSKWAMEPITTIFKAALSGCEIVIVIDATGMRVEGHRIACGKCYPNQE
jgi:hypothetical protein